MYDVSMSKLLSAGETNPISTLAGDCTPARETGSCRTSVKTTNPYFPGARGLNGSSFLCNRKLDVTSKAQ